MSEIEGPRLDVERLVHLAPRLAQIVGAVERRLFRFHHRVDDAGPRWGHRHGDPPLLTGRQPVGQLLPGIAAIAGPVEAAARSAGLEEPGPTPELPHPGVEDVGVLWVDGDVGAARVLIHEQNPLPRLAAIDGSVHAALRIGVPEVAGGADEHPVAVVGVDGDSGDPLGLGQAEMLPGVPRVVALIDARPHRHAVARPALTGADPDDVGIGGIDLDRADRLRVLVEDRLEADPRVFRLPDTAAGGTDVDRDRVVGDGVERRDPAAHHRRPDRPGLQSGEGRRLDLGLRGRRSRRGDDGDSCQGDETQNPAQQNAHRSTSGLFEAVSNDDLFVGPGDRKRSPTCRARQEKGQRSLAFPGHCFGFGMTNSESANAVLTSMFSSVIIWPVGAPFSFSEIECATIKPATSL